MKSIRFLAAPVLALALASCASSDKPGKNDTANPYGTADAGQANAPSNPVYDTPAAYEESGTAAANTAVNPPLAPYDPTPAAATPTVRPTAPSARPTTTSPSNGAATIHTVVAGDTLSGLSSKYKVPVAEIKQANSMTSDVVVLGRKMVIPPAR